MASFAAQLDAMAGLPAAYAGDPMPLLYVPKDISLGRVRNAIEAVDGRFKPAPIKHRITAVLVAFLACFSRQGKVTAEDVKEAWDELADIKRVVRGDYVLEPDEDGWWVGQLDPLPANLADYRG